MFSQKTSLSFSFFTSLLIFACTESRSSNDVDRNIKRTDTTDVKEIRIDPNSAITERHTSSFLDSVRFVPLQTTEESILGEISQMEVTSKYYIIWDEVSNSIFYFKKNGDFYRKISNNDKNLKTPFKKIDHFTVNEDQNLLRFNDSYSGLMYSYTLEGDFIETNLKPSYIGNAYSSFSSFDIYYLGYDYPKNTPTLSPANLIITENEVVKAQFLPFDTSAVIYSDLFAVDQSFYNNNYSIGRMFLSFTYDYNVYSIDNLGNVKESFRFVLPAVNSLPSDFMTNKKYNGKRMTYTTSNDNIIYSVTDIYRIKNKIIFRLFGHSINYMLLYDLSTGDLISLSNYVSDSSTFMLPILKYRIYAMDSDKALVSSIDAISLFEAKLRLAGDKDWDLSLPSVLKKFYESDNQQNPVLVINYF